MTQEQKAKAYDEALERAKSWAEGKEEDLGASAKSVAEFIFPELAESEDERIRRELKEAFAAYDIESKWNGIPIRSIFSWLEKSAKSERVIKAARRVLNNWLDGTDCPDVSGDFVELEYAIRKYDGAETPKESLHIQETCKENADSFADGIIEVRSFQREMEEGRRLERQKEQKQAQTSEEKEYIRTIKSIISDFIRDKKPENLAYYQRIYDWLDERHVPFSCGHEKGQPADPVFSKQEYESSPIISTDTTSVKPRELDGKTLLYTADKSYQIGFRDGVASVKPAEWNEEDEEMRGTCIDLLEHFPRPCGEVIGPWKDCISWLKSLPLKCPKSSDNWKPSEEQMEALDKARRFIPYNCDVMDQLYEQLKKL